MTEKMDAKKSGTSEGGRSTGPRSRAGKAISRMNAVKHGLDAFVARRDAPGEVATLTALFAGEGADEARRGVAAMAAEAHVELLRIEDAKRALVNREIAVRKGWGHTEVSAFIAAAAILMHVRRYDIRARGRRSRAFELL